MPVKRYEPEQIAMLLRQIEAEIANGNGGSCVRLGQEPNWSGPEGGGRVYYRSRSGSNTEILVLCVLHRFVI